MSGQYNRGDRPPPSSVVPCPQVLEVLLETCGWLTVGCPPAALPYWLQCVQRVAQATVLGCLLPVLHTALTHPAHHSLALAYALMARLAQLVMLTSKVQMIYRGTHTHMYTHRLPSCLVQTTRTHTRAAFISCTDMGRSPVSGVHSVCSVCTS